MARRSTQPSNSPREPFGVRLDPEVVIAIKILAAKKKTQVNLLIEESIKDLLRKNGEN